MQSAGRAPKARRVRSVGAGYTGTEVAAQGQLLTTRLARKMPGLAHQQIRWMLLDTAPRLLPELSERLSKTTDRVLRRRGVEVRTRGAAGPDNGTFSGFAAAASPPRSTRKPSSWCL